MEVKWKQVGILMNYDGSKVEVSDSMYLEWKYLGIRMELEWK